MTSPQGQLALAEAARTAQNQIRTHLLGEIARTWPLLTSGDLQARWPAWLRVMITLLTEYHARSAAAGSAYYRASRYAATGAAGTELVALAAAPTTEWITQSLGFAAANTLLRSPLPAPERQKLALTKTVGVASRIALAGGRDTITGTVRNDPEAVGWWRKTDASPCYFCALLASRGVVYKQQSFDRSNRRFDGDGTSKVHDHCGCMLAPAFDHAVALPAVNRHALEVYNDSTGGVSNSQRVNAFRKAWETRSAPAA